MHGISRAIQCNLPINLFNELIFLIIWGWLIFLSILTCISLIWCLFFMSTSISRTFIHKYLHMNFLNIRKQKRDDFIQNYLQWDGILVLQIISQNTNDMIMANLLDALFQLYMNLHEKKNDEVGAYNQISSNEYYTHVDSALI